MTCEYRVKSGHCGQKAELVRVITAIGSSVVALCSKCQGKVAIELNAKVERA